MWRGLQSFGHALFISELAGHLSDEMVKPPLPQRMGGVAFLRWQRVGPSQPVEDKLGNRFEGDLDIAFDLALADVEPVHALEDAFLHALPDFRIEILPQGLLDNGGFGGAGPARHFVEFGIDIAGKSQIETGFGHGSEVRQCVRVGKVKCGGAADRFEMACISQIGRVVLGDDQIRLRFRLNFTSRCVEFGRNLQTA